MPEKTIEVDGEEVKVNVENGEVSAEIVDDFVSLVGDIIEIDDIIEPMEKVVSTAGEGAENHHAAIVDTVGGKSLYVGNMVEKLTEHPRTRIEYMAMVNHSDDEYQYRNMEDDWAGNLCILVEDLDA